MISCLVGLIKYTNDNRDLFKNAQLNSCFQSYSEDMRVFSVDRGREKSLSFLFSKVYAHLEQEQHLPHEPHFGFRKTPTGLATVASVTSV